MLFEEKNEILKKVIELSQSSSADGDCDYASLSFKLGTTDVTFFSKYDYSIEKDEILEGTERAENWVCLIYSLQVEEDYYGESCLVLRNNSLCFLFSSLILLLVFFLYQKKQLQANFGCRDQFLLCSLHFWEQYL